MTNQDLVAEFHRTFGVPIAGAPTVLSDDVCALRVNLMREELDELEEALLARDLVATADAIGDLLVTVYDTALAVGIDADRVMEEVHRSNMSKLGPDGKPILRADGKVLKGPGFVSPDLSWVLKEATA